MATHTPFPPTRPPVPPPPAVDLEVAESRSDNIASDAVAPPVEFSFDQVRLDDVRSPPDVDGDQATADLETVPLEAIPAGPAAALAFATDSDTEVAFRDGLLGYESSSTDSSDPQVWQGGLRAAIAALTEGFSAPLIFVDIDEIPYPAGAIHELAAVCEVGTVVVAVGSDDSARRGREMLLAGVSDYLAKPLTAGGVRAAALAAREASNRRPGGCVAGFFGSGGSGTTTLVAVAALHAAACGCYVSVLDLNRSVAAAALALGVEPAAGLDQLLEAAGRATPDPETMEGVCVRRSERIEVCAHRWTPAHAAAPSPAAVDRLLAAFKHRSQLVLVEGFDQPSMRFSPSIQLDARVFVAEPTMEKAASLGRMMDMLGADPLPIFVQNHTRAFRRGRGERALRDAGIELEPDVVIPFEPALPEAADRGWPQTRLPRSLRKPVGALTDRLLGTVGVGAVALSRPPQGS